MNPNWNNWDEGYLSALLTVLEKLDDVFESMGEHKEILMQGILVAQNEVEGLIDDIAESKAKANHAK